MLTYAVLVIVAFAFWAISEVPKPRMSKPRRKLLNAVLKTIALIATYTALVELFRGNMNNGWVVTFTFATFAAFATTLSARMFNVTARDKATRLVSNVALVVILVSVVPAMVHLFKTATAAQLNAFVIPCMAWTIADETLRAWRAEDPRQKTRHMMFVIGFLIVLVLYVAGIVMRALY